MCMSLFYNLDLGPFRAGLVMHMGRTGGTQIHVYGLKHLGQILGSFQDRWTEMKSAALIYNNKTYIAN